MTDDKMLDRVRKLLAKAENAGSEHEAETYTAKATELMLKYSIDEALLQKAGEKKDEHIVVRKVRVEGYAKAKLSLMHAVARGLGLRSVQYSNGRAGWSTGTGEVVGWESDVASFDVLFSSLQMQAAHEADRELARIKSNWPELRRIRDEWVGLSYREQCYREGEGWSQRRDRYAAWLAENPEPEDPGRVLPHGRAFRQSFLIGYAGVVGHRLAQQRREAVKVADDERPGAAIAVRDRFAEVDTYADGYWGKLTKGTSASTSSNAGYYSGRAAGARANLGQTSVGGGRRAIGR